MKQCEKCNRILKHGEDKVLHKKVLCDDCYIERVLPKMHKTHEQDDAEFMRRLKESHTVRKQQFH